MFLTQTVLSLLDALLKLQNANGMWHTLLDDPQSYVEASATAGFAYGYLKSVRMRLVAPERAKVYAEAGKKAVDAVLQRITAQGELTEVRTRRNSAHKLNMRRIVPGVVRHACVRQPGRLSQDPIDEHAVRPESGAIGHDRVLSHVMVDKERRAVEVFYPVLHVERLSHLR